MDPIRILLIDDHQLFRDGIKTMFKKTSDIIVVHEANNGLEGIELLNMHYSLIDLIVLDMSMPDMDGIEFLSEIKHRGLNKHAIMLTMHDDLELMNKAKKLGVRAYVNKDVCNDDLDNAIRLAMNSTKKFVFKSNKLPTEGSVCDLPNPVKSLALLSSREKAVLRLICKEYTSVEIANELKLSINTIESHRKKLLIKTGSKNIAGLVIFAHNTGLIQH